MRVNKKIFLSVICLLTFLICSLSGCVSNKYHSVLYDKAIDFDWLTKEYLDDNIVVFSSRENQGNKDDYPTERTNVISNQEEFDWAFEYFPDEVDFEKEVVIVYFFCSINPIYIDGEKRLNYRIKDIKLVNKELSITVTSRRKLLSWLMAVSGTTAYASSAPARRCLIIKMEKPEFETANVNRE